MTKRLNKRVKTDVALAPQSLNGAGTGRFYGMDMHRSVIAVLNVGTLAAGATAQLELIQAKDAAGTDAKGIPTDAAQAAKALITANEGATVMQCVVGAPANGDTIIVNDVTFTKAAATDVTKREFLDAAGLASCINDAGNGVKGVTAVNNAGTITLTATDAGETTITASHTGAALTLSTLQAQAYVETEASQLDLANEFGFVAVRVTTSAAANVGAVIVRGDSRFEPDQAVAASATV